MKKQSAGILIFRNHGGRREYLLVHPGGPFWKNKDAGAWSIPKGEFEEREDPLTAAKRELKEETGFSIEGDFIPLTPITQKGGKKVVAWAVNGNPDITSLKSNEFEMEWPPHSGKKQKFPEVDRAEWFSKKVALEKILPAQIPFITETEERFTD